MKPTVLFGLLRDGKKPMVRLTGNLWDDSFGEKGMIAQVTEGSEEPHDLLRFKFDYNANRDHNLALDKPQWFLSDEQAEKVGRKRGTAVESGFFDDPNDISEEMGFDQGEDIPVELVEEETPLALYLASGDKRSYVEWLEAKLEELVPDCMKDWKKGL